MFEVNVGETWFLRAYNAFVHIHGMKSGYFIIGGLSEFEGDARTNISRCMVRPEILGEHVDYAYHGLDTEETELGHVRVKGSKNEAVYDDKDAGEGLFEDCIIMEPVESRTTTRTMKMTPLDWRTPKNYRVG